MGEIQQLLNRTLPEIGIELYDRQFAQVERYASFLVEYNQKVNLTAILDPRGIAIKHFYDSLTLLTAVDLPAGSRLADVGSGAGFPGVPMAIARPDLCVSLFDSLQKRVVFLDQLARELQLQNVEAYHLRAEEAGQDRDWRESFELVTARAVSSLAVLCEYCLPLVKVGGCFAAMKGAEYEAEVLNAHNAMQVLGGALETTKQLILPNGEQRAIIVIRKTSQTSTKYPRSAGKITKRPL